MSLGRRRQETTGKEEAMYKRTVLCVLFVSALGMLFLVDTPRAQAGEDPSKYPTQTIRMIVPFAPGGASDFAARLLQPGMSEFLGKQIVIENRAGAAGNVGMDVAARATPDGYTIFLGNVGTVCINPFMFSDLTVKPDKDFIGVSVVAETPGLLIANPKFPPNNAKEFVEYVKARQGQINFASPGSGSLNRLEMELFRKNAGLDMTHIPYKGGAGPATADVMGGHVSVMFVTISSAINFVKEGRLKAVVAKQPDDLVAKRHGTATWHSPLCMAGTTPYTQAAWPEMEHFRLPPSLYSLPRSRRQSWAASQ